MRQNEQGRIVLRRGSLVHHSVFWVRRVIVANNINTLDRTNVVVYGCTDRNGPATET